jgi:hypothetical protein
MRYGGGFGLGTIIYLIVGAFVAGAHDYFDRLGGLKGVVSALLALILWPLVLLGIDLQIR